MECLAGQQVTHLQVPSIEHLLPGCFLEDSDYGITKSCQESLAWNKRSDPMSMAWFDEPNALLQVLRPFLILLHQSFATCCISTGVIEAGCRSVPKSKLLRSENLSRVLLLMKIIKTSGYGFYFNWCGILLIRSIAALQP